MALDTYSHDIWDDLNLKQNPLVSTVYIQIFQRFMGKYPKVVFEHRNVPI